MSFVVGALFALVAASVQDTVRATLVSRESKPLDLPSYTQLVRGQHPVARQARLARRIAGAELRSARGAIWDPVASVSWDRKTFKGTSYYD